MKTPLVLADTVSLEREPIGFRIWYRDGKAEEVEGNSLSVANDGSLMIVDKRSKDTGISNARGEKQVEVMSRVVLIVPADVWTRVTSIDHLSSQEEIEAGAIPHLGLN